MQATKYKILLVEDVVVAQKIAVLTLSELDCEIDIAETGRQALALATQNHYHVIFMDLGLEDMDGFAVTENIRRMKNSNHNTPIIALTAHANEEMKIKCLSAGIDDYIAKPIKAETALSILEQYARR